MKKSHYNVSRLSNTQIKTQLKNALTEIGVQMVNVDLGRGSIEVGYDENIDENIIRQCIEDVGCIIK